MRVLMVIGLPWRSDLGAVRPQFEVAAELRRRGHAVDHFGFEEAFGTAPRSRVRALLGERFARIASRRVATIAADYDVIDANEGHLPVSKSELRFDGLLVTRSNGLRAAYRAWEREAVRQWPAAAGRYRLVRCVRRVRAAAEDRDAARSHRNADLLLVLNDAERAAVEAERLAGEHVVVPHGVSSGYLAAVAEQARDLSRLAASTVVCVGTWDRRKGAHDWPAIVERVLELVPHARFAFLGVGVEELVVREALATSAPPERVSVVRRFEPSELGSLLARATVGALPSYIEGSPLAVLEQLAAGIPCVVYDNPGSRGATAPLGDEYRVAPGDVRAFADQLVAVMSLDERTYADAARASRAFAEPRTWEHSASLTLASYQAGLARIGRRSD